MFNNFIFLKLFLYILCNILVINNSNLDYSNTNTNASDYNYNYDYEPRLNIFENSFQIPVKRILIDGNNNIHFTK